MRAINIDAFLIRNLNSTLLFDPLLGISGIKGVDTCPLVGSVTTVVNKNPPGN